MDATFPDRIFLVQLQESPLDLRRMNAGEATRALFGFVEDEKSISSRLMAMTAMLIRKSW